MSKVAVVYWSSTGNTEAMANAVAEGAKAAGAEVSVFETADFDAAKSAYDSMLDEYTSLTGITFNYTDDSDSSIEGESTDKTKEKGIFSKFFGGKKK